MAMTTVTVIAATTNASATGSSTALSATNKFAVLIESAAPPPAFGSISFAVSWDGTNYYTVDPAIVRGNVFIFDSPANNVRVSFAGNPTGNNVTVLAYAYTD